MKKTQFSIAVLAVLCFIMALLLTSFQIAIYGDPSYQFYEKEYEKYEVAEDLQMNTGDIMDVTKHMMAYLIGEQEELSVETNVNGQRRDFFNEQDRLHMADVKHLFLSGLKLRWILLLTGGLLLLLIVLKKGSIRKLLPKAYGAGLCIFGVLTALVGLLFASDFTKYFTIFHEIFFTNDLWMFDPAEDLMIRMLPEGFFYDMVFRIGLMFAGLLLLAGIFCIIWVRTVKKRERKTS